MKSLLGAALLIFTLSCAHGQRNSISAVDRYTAGDEIYEGLENSFSFKATLINQSVQEELLQKQADHYDWSSLTLQAERQKIEDDGLQSTEVFLSFYTPRPKDASLTDKNSIWRVYLSVGSNTYDAEIVRDRRKLTEIRSLFPYHSHWAYAYRLRFPIPISHVELGPSRLTITGPVGKKSVDFPAVQTR